MEIKQIAKALIELPMLRKWSLRIIN
jgi:hypothetical protein